MSAVEIVPFTDGHLAGAAALLTSTHAQHRRAEPIVAESDARAALEGAWRRDDTSGTAAVRDGELLGYLFGREAENDNWSRHVVVDRAGHAAGEPELTRSLFAAAADRWWKSGLQQFFVNVPSLAERLDPWYRLGFAQTQPDARGTGAGLALTAHVLAWARENGFGTMVTTWRVTNLLASRFWPARGFGFRPTFVRLHRAPGIT